MAPVLIVEEDAKGAVDGSQLQVLFSLLSGTRSVPGGRLCALACDFIIEVEILQPNLAIFDFLF